MDISQFKSALGAGGARPNQFLIMLTYPALVGPSSINESILVTAAALPASNVNPCIVMYRGREVKFAGERTFDPWTITVMNDTDMSVRRKFEAWSNLMNNRTDNSGFTNPRDYMSTIFVNQLDRNADASIANNQYIRQYVLYDAYPITVSEVGLSYSANDVISEFNVTFHYQHFEVTPL